MSMWQATKLHLIAMGVWGAQIHWSVKSVMDMYNMFMPVAFAESRGKVPTPSQVSNIFLRQLYCFIKSLH